MRYIATVMATGLLLILQIFLCCLTVTTATIYNYNETSEEVPYEYDNSILSGFRDDVNKDFILGGLFSVYDCTGARSIDTEHLEAMLFAIDRINNDETLLPNLVIGYDIRDTCNDKIVGFIEALNIYLSADNSSVPLLGIVGPAGSHVTLPIANLFDLFEIPMVSYASSTATLSNKIFMNTFYGLFHHPTFRLMQWLI